MLSVDTALSTHTACFICRDKTRPLREVKKKDIIHAYTNHKIFIKHHARCCDAHYDDNGFIRKEEFDVIPTKKKIYDQHLIKLFDVLRPTSDNIFEQFQKPELIEENLCKKFTGLTKIQFLQLSEFIISLNQNTKRTKYQLIALYLYWLKTGMNQKDLALIFGKNASQRCMSRYLNQIRFAIHKDFVPLFLGAEKNRDFYLRYNSIMTQSLFDLEDDVLVLIADGTSCRIQKSNNNNFQYKTYSGQKKDSLFKPFIICCADGYILDCYGPFPANDNDSKILNYIIETDDDLKKILLPNKTLFLIDRGFRDSFQFLREKELNPKIPTCVQLEEIKENQLTVDQTSKSRLVTKCRFIIEKKIGEIKKNKALDNRLNVEVNHLQFDYRNTCAIINFTHKACCADKDKAIEISVKIKNKIKNVHSNPLEHLNKIQFGTKKNPFLKFENLSDFPILSLDEMQGEIFYGSYYLKQSKSYFSDMHKTDSFCNITTTVLNSYISINSRILDILAERLNSFKIIGLCLTSRHLRSLKTKKKNNLEEELTSEEEEENGTDINQIRRMRFKYKVFIEYQKDFNHPNAIKNYFCTCKSGKKQAGCCMHVAACIHYLSFARYSQIMKMPGEYLNSVLVDMDIKQSPKKPNFVKNTRTNDIN